MADELSSEETSAERDELIVGGEERRKKAHGYYCGAAREAGILILVFASLDVMLGGSTRCDTSFWNLAAWWCVGLLVFFLGVHLDPEVRK